MKENLTELVFILDKSGSMSGLERDTIGGYNSMIQKQRTIGGRCMVTTVLFDNHYELLHDRVDLKKIKPITGQEYVLGGSTALLDAIGKTIYRMSRFQREMSKEYRAEKVLFVIITDGEENSSRDYDTAQVKSMIEKQKKCYGWEFLFLGANMDAVETAGRFGIDSDRAVDYVPDSEGIILNFSMMSETVTAFRKSGEISQTYLDSIRKDRKKRGKNIL